MCIYLHHIFINASAFEHFRYQPRQLPVWRLGILLLTHKHTHTLISSLRHPFSATRSNTLQHTTTSCNTQHSAKYTYLPHNTHVFGFDSFATFYSKVGWVHVCVRVFVCAYMWLCVRVCMCACARVCACEWISTHACLQRSPLCDNPLWMWWCSCKCVWVRACISMLVRAYIKIYTLPSSRLSNFRACIVCACLHVLEIICSKTCTLHCWPPICCNTLQHTVT